MLDMSNFQRGKKNPKQNKTKKEKRKKKKKQTKQYKTPKNKTKTNYLSALILWNTREAVGIPL